MGAKLMIAILVIFVSLIGFGVWGSGRSCLANQTTDTSKPMWKRCYGNPVWGQYATFASEEEVGNAVNGALIATLVVNGLIIGAYKMFGKDKTVNQTPEEEK